MSRRVLSWRFFLSQVHAAAADCGRCEDESTLACWPAASYLRSDRKIARNIFRGVTMQ